MILLIGSNDVRRDGTANEARAGAREIDARPQARGIEAINARPYHAAARRAGIAALDGLHRNAEGQRDLAAQLASEIG